MKKVFLMIVTLALMGAGCAQPAAVNTNTNVNREATTNQNDNTNNAATTLNGNTNTNGSAVSGSVNVNAEIDALLKETADEQANEASGDDSDLTTDETLDLDAMIGASGNY